jgi:HEAT repeat protein
VRVRIDADRDPDAVRLLAVGPIPALRILTPAGRVVAARNGFLNVQDLVAWLNDHFQQAIAVPARELADAGAPDAASVDRLVTQLSNPDAVSREAATRRLIRVPALAATKVAGVFASGNLRQRLAVLELLHAWRAPVDDVDPWNLQSITPDTIAALKKWSESADLTASTRPTALTGPQLLLARREITAMLQAQSPSEVQASRERLARIGPALLAEVQKQISESTTDRDRQRLAALRYRLASSDALALNWPDGFDRLASIDQKVRRSSLDELSSRLTPDDEPLLTELFASPDPFVRERSLEFMQAAGSDAARIGLVKLLHDPEPNVRAAVLKQLSDTPDAAYVPEVVKYVGSETDTDLIVHAVRFFREVKTSPAIDALMSLLGNASWRVRAEAAVALGKCLESNRGSEHSDAVYAAMDKLLDDPDGFVAGQAVIVLKGAPVGAHVTALVKAAEKRPELAPDVIKVLAGDTQSPKSQEQLHKFASSPNLKVKVAALSALGENATGDEIIAALNDGSRDLRVVGAKRLMELLATGRPDHRNRFQAPGTAKADWVEWLAGFRAGKGRPDWVPRAIDPLKNMLDSADAPERVSAAVALAALTDDQRPRAVLRDEAGRNKSLARDAAEALPWLVFEPRLELFNALRVSMAGDNGALGGLAELFGATSDPRAADPLWNLLADRSADINLAAAIHTAIGHIYFGDEATYFGGQPQVPAAAKAMVPRARDLAASGTSNQRLVAMSLLLRASPDDASEAARLLVQSTPIGQGLRVAAFQIQLCALDKKAARAAAIERLGGNDPQLKKISLVYLAEGTNRLRVIQDRLYLESNPIDEVETSASGQPIVVLAPPGLTADPLKPLLNNPDAEIQAYAGYLMCLLQYPEGLDLLMRQWRRQPSESQWRTLAYRAVAALGDDARTPFLAELYRSFGKDQQWELRNFYWTIRSMQGPEILKLRKQIRDEVGMQNLQ